MKRIVKLIVTVLPIFILSCNDITVDNPEPLDYFMKFYGNYHNDKLYDIKATTNEEIILTGYRVNAEGSENAWIIKTSTDGMVEWEKEYSGTNNFRGYGLFVDQNIYYAGFEMSELTNNQQGFLCNYSMDGNLIDSLSFNIMADEVKDIKFLNHNANHRFLVHVALNGSDRLNIYELNNNEINLISTNPLYNTIEGSIYFYEEQNGDLYITGSFNEVDNEGFSDIMVTRFVDDNILWSYNYGEAGITEEASGIVLFDNSLYIAASNKNNSEENVYILKLTSSGLDAETINVDLTGNNTSYSMIVNSTNEFVFVGERKIDEYISKVFMARTSLTGEVLLENEYGYEGTSRGRFVINLTGTRKGFIIAGNIATSSASEDAVDVLVIKVDEFGEWIY